MNILLTNDDGIHSEGLWAIAETLSDIGSVTIVVPDRDQSGMGSSTTLLTPLTIQKNPSRVPKVTEVYTVDGRPGDCVIVANEVLMDHNIDLLVAGINPGANLGIDVFNSGTFGAALHGYFRSINAIAVSVKYDDRPVINFPAAKIGALVAQYVLDLNPANKLLLNINLPPCQLDEIQGVEMTTLGGRAFGENVEEIQNGRRTHYWIKHNRAVDMEWPKGCDVDAVNRDCVSITSVYPHMSENNSEFDNQRLLTDLNSLTK